MTLRIAISSGFTNPCWRKSTSGRGPPMASCVMRHIRDCDSGKTMPKFTNLGSYKGHCLNRPRCRRSLLAPVWAPLSQDNHRLHSIRQSGPSLHGQPEPRSSLWKNHLDLNSRSGLLLHLTALISARERFLPGDADQRVSHRMKVSEIVWQF